MKRLMIAVVVMVVLMGAGIADASHPWDGISGRRHPWDYRYRSRPVVQVGVDYDCNFYPENAQNSYPPGSLLSIVGLPSYNEEQYWAYQNRILDLGEKQVQQSGSSHPYISDPQLLEETKQRAKLQKIEDENQTLKNKIAELEKRLNQLATKEE